MDEDTRADVFVFVIVSLMRVKEPFFFTKVDFYFLVFQALPDFDTVSKVYSHSFPFEMAHELLEREVMIEDSIMVLISLLGFMMI